MLSKKHIKDEILSNSLLIRQHGISKIGLFGSFARQEQTSGSDIDILIDFQQDKETFDNFMAICDLLDSIFKGYKVEVVTMGGLSPYIGPHILNSVEYVQIAN
jgi:predicted nucleotidyltransferase